ncbi:hypothetical protein A3C23_03530 [Candidatus Roizmanbacteria bacterium RIFCSPHIGHO2_02_FULL_37_13b]|uniref:RNA-binding protein KhpA n=1 Tax=Candidatus Roizmanbacteria bacterium RIFCSPLOWO2_02_FULL_36_11 TaxID=1802071 RepID=A0A1F7JC20_9BACT|nr:MAG: hypothetical protein A3C23_03530 [Candidatus Roizmanbacteria bacterium RIFCSPHIGHO2_02_FULL_37_13b]OGK53142.1 MAG: hypothetical protein A3H78_02045 [Candidatus Roizmanbacteria bacterium RIFCSPLOWO2_02_FULL_36_11]
MDKFLQFLIEEIVDDVSGIHIIKSDEVDAQVFHITLSKDDYGKVIGKSGKTINAIRTLLNVYSLKKDVSDHKKIVLKVEEAS